MSELMTRVVNLMGKPIGVVPVARAFPPASNSTSRQEAFSNIFRGNGWGSAESQSGVGSEQHYASAYLQRLISLLRERQLLHVFDAPCGDLNWVHPLLGEQDISYHGGDIVAELVEETRTRYPTARLSTFDICSDPFPAADVWHCRDCLFHLPFADIQGALQNFVSSGIPYALLTTHRARYLTNLDVAAGGFRYLDLERPPVQLPAAEHYIRDFRPLRDFPRYVGLWSRDSIAAALLSD